MSGLIQPTHLLVIVAIVLAIWYARRHPKAAPAGRLCTICGFAGYPVKEKPGSVGMEILLFCLFIVPGLFYALWRWKAPGDNRCPSCRSLNTMIPLDSIKGKRLLDDLTS
jgi:hypothetical protein